MVVMVTIAIKIVVVIVPIVLRIYHNPLLQQSCPWTWHGQECLPAQPCPPRPKVPIAQTGHSSRKRPLLLDPGKERNEEDFQLHLGKIPVNRTQILDPNVLRQVRNAHTDNVRSELVCSRLPASSPGHSRTVPRSPAQNLKLNSLPGLQIERGQ